MTVAFGMLTPDRVDAATVGALADWSCASAVESPTVRAQLLLRALTDDAEVMDALGEVHRAYPTTFAEFYRQLFDGTGVELAEGITYGHLAVMLTALLYGLTIRRRIGPEAADTHVVSSMALALLCGLLLRNAPEPRASNQHQATFESWPSEPTLSERFNSVIRCQ